MEEIKPLEAFKRNRRIPIKIKIEAINFAKQNNNKKASIKYGVTTKTIRKWKLNELKFKTVSDLESRITLHPPPIINPNVIDLDKELYAWIDFNRSLGNAITTWSIAVEIIKKDPSKSNLKPKALLQLVYRFMKRNSLTIRQGSHIGQQLPFNAVEKTFAFLKEIIRIRRDKDISSDCIIINMDETALQLNMPFHKTVHKVGAKTISIKTQRQEKCRISLILSICSNGEKLKPLIILKGAKNGRIYKNLLKLSEVTNNKCIVECNQTAWATKDIIKNWIEKVYISYFNGKDLSKTLLVFDRATMHDSYEIINYLIKKK